MNQPSANLPVVRTSFDYTLQSLWRSGSLWTVPAIFLLTWLCTKDVLQSAVIVAISSLVLLVVVGLAQAIQVMAYYRRIERKQATRIKNCRDLFGDQEFEQDFLEAVDRVKVIWPYQFPKLKLCATEADLIEARTDDWCPDEMIPFLFETACPTFIGFVPKDNQSLSEAQILVFRVHTYVHGWNDLDSFISDNLWRRVGQSNEA